MAIEKEASVITTGRHIELHYSPNEIGKRWGVSGNTIRRLFEDEVGVLLIDRPEKMHKRQYKTMRIPESVIARVHAQWEAK